jgi:hypothetical protein
VADQMQQLVSGTQSHENPNCTVQYRGTYAYTFSVKTDSSVYLSWRGRAEVQNDETAKLPVGFDRDSHIAGLRD